MNILEQYAAEILGGVPEGFRFYKYECFPKNGQQTIYMELTGSVPPIKTRGKNKGKPNWKAAPKDSHRTAVVLCDKFEAWKEKWESDTGKCWQCEGTREVFQSWNIETGTKKKTCPRCLGSGSMRVVA